MCLQVQPGRAPWCSDQLAGVNEGVFLQAVKLTQCLPADAIHLTTESLTAVRACDRVAGQAMEVVDRGRAPPTAVDTAFKITVVALPTHEGAIHKNKVAHGLS